jgi:Tfp pilus assembly protein PilE
MQPSERGRAGYTLVELIGAVVIAAVLLALTMPGIAHALRVRQAEAVLKHDLHNAANVYEQAYLTDRLYPEFQALEARGFRLSPNIALDSQAVAGERVYLRLRHVPTGQLCVLDYSRSSAVARNRADCYAGGQERDTALAVTAEPPPAPPSDTFGVRPPAPPDTAENALALASPSVDSPASQSARPGSSLTQTFTITNRSPVARTFRFEAGSSSPTVVPTPAAPAPLTLLPGVPTPVIVSYTAAADALADASTVIPLRAVDAEDERWSATGSFTVSTALALADPAVALGGPAARVEDAGQPFDVSWSVTNRTNAARMLVLSLSASAPAHLQVVSTASAGRVPFAPGQTRAVTARLLLADDFDGGTRSTATLEAWDADAPAYRAAAALTAETRTVLAAPAITAPAARSADPGTPFSLTWSVRNASNQARSFQVTPSVADPGHLEIVGSTGTGVQTLGRGQALAVSVTYRVKPGAVAGRTSDAALQVADRAAPQFQAGAAVAIGTNTVLANPAITPPAAQTAKPDEELTVTWTVRNGANAPRVLVLDPSVLPAAEVILVSSTGSGEVPFGPAETRVVSARYRMRGGSLAGATSAPALAATDKLAPSYAACANFEFTTAADYRDPVLAAPADRGADPGTGSTAVFRLQNRSNLPRTFTLAATSTNGAAVADPADPAPVAVPAYGSADVPIAVAVPAGALGYAQAAVALRAADAGQPALAGAAQLVVTVNPVYLPPTLAWPGTATVRPGAAAVDSATLVNRSNVPVEYCFAVAVEPGNVGEGLVVAPQPAPPPCRTLGAAGTPSAAAAVPVAFSGAGAALAGWSNVVTLTAAGSTPAPVSAAAPLPVTAELVLADPAWVALPVSPMQWDEGDERELSFTFRNASNGTRSFCVELRSADAGKLDPGAVSPACGIHVGPRDTLRLARTLRALGPATGLHVSALVYDQDAAVHRAEGGFYNVIRASRPIADWTAPAPVYLRRWATFDGSRSRSPVGSPIVRYVWTWGLFMQQWDPAQGRFVYTGTWGTARDEVTTPVVQRAYDLLGTFQVCLSVVDAAGRMSDPNCQQVTTIRPTVARLAWRYRGWWSDRDWCLDVWWDNQCDPEHGNARWEIDLRPSVGDVPIKEAYAVVRVKLHNTDDPNRPATVTYAGNAGTTPPWGSYTFGQDYPEAVGKAQDGRWRVLTTVGTSAFGWPASPNLANHPLVLNINLADATGIADSGPHWVPDDVWITLYVQDAYDRWTSVSAYRNHDKGQWKRAYDTTVVAQARPTASVSLEPLGEGKFLATGSGDSPEGRIVDAWWELTFEDIGSGATSTRTTRDPTVEVEPSQCERITVTYVVKDNLGAVGRSSDLVRGEGGSACFDPGGGVFR